MNDLNALEDVLNTIESLQRIMLTNPNDKTRFLLLKLSTYHQNVKDVANEYKIWDSKFKELKRNGNSLFAPHIGISDYFIWDDDFETRKIKNKELDQSKDLLQKFVFELEN